MNKNIFYTLFLILPALGLSKGCSTHIEPRAEHKEPTEAQKEEARKIQQRVRSTISDPIYDVAEAACRYKNEYGRWPSVEFSTIPESQFESFTSTSKDNGTYETTFRLKAFPSTLVMIVGLEETENRTPNCRLTLLPKSSTKSHSQFEAFLKGKHRPVTRDFAFYKDRVILDTPEDRDAFAALFVFVTILTDIQSNPSLRRETASERFAAKGVEAAIKIALCIALRVNPSQCK